MNSSFYTNLFLVRLSLFESMSSYKDTLDRLAEEEANERYHLQYLDREIRFLEDIIKKKYRQLRLNGNRSYTSCKEDIAFLEKDLSNFYEKERKFLLKCEKRQKERDLERDTLERRNFYEQIRKNLQEVSKSISKSCEARKVVSKVPTIEVEEKKRGDVLEVKEENSSIPCELSLTNNDLPSFLEEFKFIQPIQEDIIEDVKVVLKPLTSIGVCEDQKKMLEEEREYSAMKAQGAANSANTSSSTSLGNPMGRDNEREKKVSDSGNNLGKEAESKKKVSKQINGPLVSENKRRGKIEHTFYARVREKDVGQPIFVIHYKGYLFANNQESFDSLPSSFVFLLQDFEPCCRISIHEVRNFHGLISCYGRGMHNYSSIAAPLTSIMKKEVDFV